jgi:hypothetical protein
MGWSPFRKTGLTYHQPSQSVKGYTLVTPIAGDSTYLLDMSGQIVHRWLHASMRVFYARLLENGRLLALGTDRSVATPVIEPGATPPFEVGIRRIGGNATHLVEIDQQGETVWQYANPAIHHDFVRLANGHTLMPEFIELPSPVAREVRGGYRDRQKTPPLISDDFVEIDQRGKEVRRIHLWQLLDPRRDPICPLERRIEWTHTNSLDVTASGDIVFSCRVNSRIGIIEGASGKLRWKYGAPNIHHQHHASALENGNIQVFDNGMHRVGMPRSAVVEVNPKDDAVVWQFISDPDIQFFSAHISGAERLPGGNVLISEGASGRIFEIARRGEVVWEWISPFANRNPAGMLVSWVFRAHRLLPGFPGLSGLELNPGRYSDLNRLYGLAS